MKTRPGFKLLRKQRTGQWTVTGSGGGTVQDTDTGTDDDTDVDDDDDDEDEDEEDDPKSQKVTPEQLKTANDEAKRRRLQFKEERAERRKLQQEIDNLKNQGKSDSDKIVQERDKLKTQVEELEPKFRELSVRHVGMLEAIELGVDPKNMKAVLRLSDLDDVEIEDDGTVDKDAVKAAIKATLSEYPSFGSKASNGNGKDDDDKDDLPATGGKHGNRKNRLNNNSDDELRRKYPALGV